MKKCICKKLPITLNNFLYDIIKQENRFNNTALAGKLINLWKPNKDLKVSFQLYDSSPKLIDEILEIANTWSKYCSMNFVYEKQNEFADILVSLRKNRGFYSAIGLHSKVFASKNKPSMNLDPKSGIEPDFSRKKEPNSKYCKYLILHEFGHALGLIHEHQREDRPFHFNKHYIKRYFKILGMPSYDVAKENILQTYENQNIIKSRFDYKSIMIYPFERFVIKENFSIKIPYELSEIDKIKISKIYP